MGRNDSPDSEFDQEMERILRHHFDEEASDLSSPNDPWPWLESRLEEPAPPPFFSRVVGYLRPVREGRLSPAFATVGVAVVAVAAAAVFWAASGNGGGETLDSPEGLASAQPTTAPAAGSTRAPMTVPRSASATAAPGASTFGATPAPAPAAGPTTAPRASTFRATPAPVAAAGPTTAPGASTFRATPVPTGTGCGADGGPGGVHFPGNPGTGTGCGADGSCPSPTHGRCCGGTGATRGSRSDRAAGGRHPRAARLRTPPSGTTSASPSLRPRRTMSRPLAWTQTAHPSSWRLTGRGRDTRLTPDSVRPEEWLNAFHYRYDPPPSDDRFAIRGDLYPHPLDDGLRLARIAFQAPEVVDDRPLNVTLVLDASGSMADGNRVAIARQAAESIRQSLRPEDRIAVVHFTEDVIGRYTVEHAHPESGRVRDSISWLQPHGSTNVQAGLDLGVQLADQVRDRRPDARNYVILMSDGVANVDATDPFAILEKAYDSETGNPLRLITIGVGINNYNDHLLEQLAQHGNGWYRYLDSPEQAQATFARENWLALSSPFADQTRAQVTWDAESVERWRIIGYENRVTDDENFVQDRKEFAEVYSGAATTVLYELELTESALSQGDVSLGRVEIRWVDPDTADPRSQAAALSGDPGAEFSGQFGARAHFGAIVALTADLYGGLSRHYEEAYGSVHLRPFGTPVTAPVAGRRPGELDSYHDFSFLCNT